MALTFDDFMGQVEHEISLIAGMSSAELLPYSYFTAWESGADPIYTAHKAMEQNCLI